jgi:AraC-like DNA-binding protein
VEQCERSLEALETRRGIDEATLDILDRREGVLSFVKVAAALGMSPRTYKRRLQEAGVRFSELLEKARRERALLLLRSPELTLDDIAESLGYSTTSNLSRAFRRWTGMTPAGYRRIVSNAARINFRLSGEGESTAHGRK